MTLLLSCQHISKSYGSRLLFKDLSLSVFKGERIGLIGPNGAGKSTFLKILASLETSDEGSLTLRKEIKIGYIPQIQEFSHDTPSDLLLSALEGNSQMADYEKELQVDIWLSKLGFDESKLIPAHLLSGGWKKRLAIAIALIEEPDVLLLDEPTNHLDLEGILWLEKFLLREASTFVMISHDRAFLDKIMTRIIEINPLYPKGLFSVEGPYSQFLEKRDLFIEGQLEQERALAGKARRELDWVRRSPQARTTKSQARLDAAEEMFQEHKELKRRNKTKTADISFEASERQTRQLIVLKSIKMVLGDKTLFEGLDLVLSPGVRLGLMGPNGSGKTTLLKLLAKELEPTSGTIKRAEDLKIVYFDQHRNRLPSITPLKEALSPEGDYVHYQGRSIHVSGWAKKFLFSPDLLDMPIGKLSGGERARISIARLVLQPADVLLLDEPTNDLDIQTLETLERSLEEFSGAVVLITHDRTMLEHLCDSYLALGAEGRCEPFASLKQWETFALASREKTEGARSTKEDKLTASESKKKLSYKEKKELETLETKIEEDEKSLQLLRDTLNDPSLSQDRKRLDELCLQIDTIQKRLDLGYERWNELA